MNLSPRGTGTRASRWGSFAAGVVLGLVLVVVALGVADWANGLRGVG